MRDAIEITLKLIGSAILFLPALAVAIYAANRKRTLEPKRDRYDYAAGEMLATCEDFER